MFVNLKNRFDTVLALVTIMVLLISSCTGDSEDRGTLSSEPQVKHSKIDTAELHSSLRNNSFSPRLAPRELLENFNYCIDNAETDFTCKFYIAKAISEYYGIDDFKDGESFLDYEKIRDIVENSGNWTKLGEATDQEVLEKAQLQANNGVATIAINTDNAYGHVVIILKGNLTKAHNWAGLMVPNCASFFMTKSLQSFVNKSMAYAYSSPESVYLYTKK